MSHSEIIDDKVQQLLNTEEDEVIAVIAIMKSGKDKFMRASNLEVVEYFPHEDIEVLKDVELKKTFVDIRGKKWCCYKNFYFPC